MHDRVFSVEAMFHDGFVNLKKNITVYGHVTFLGNLLKKVNVKKMDLIPTSNLNFVKPQGLPPSYPPLAEATEEGGEIQINA